MLTLKHAGCSHRADDNRLSLTRSPTRLQRRRASAADAASDVATRTRVCRIIGKPALQAVEIENLDTGDRRIIECDTLVLTGDWIPDHELARAAGIDMDPETQGPLVDTALRTSRPGVFAVGNLLHPVDTADIAALDGRHVAEPVRAYLRKGTAAADLWVSGSSPKHRCAGSRRICCGPDDPAPPRKRLLLWTDRLIRFPTITVSQLGKVIATKRTPWPASPGTRLPDPVIRPRRHRPRPRRRHHRCGGRSGVATLEKRFKLFDRPLVDNQQSGVG